MVTRRCGVMMGILLALLLFFAFPSNANVEDANIEERANTINTHMPLIFGFSSDPPETYLDIQFDQCALRRQKNHYSLFYIYQGSIKSGYAVHWVAFEFCPQLELKPSKGKSLKTFSEYNISGKWALVHDPNYFFQDIGVDLEIYFKTLEHPVDVNVCAFQVGRFLVAVSNLAEAKPQAFLSEGFIACPVGCEF